MTTETPAPDDVVRQWSDDLEEELVEVGMEPASARAYRRAFELGMTRVLSVVATKQELNDATVLLRGELRDAIGDLRGELREAIGDLRDELKGEIAGLRSEMRFYFLLLAGLFASVLGVILTKL